MDSTPRHYGWREVTLGIPGHPVGPPNSHGDPRSRGCHENAFECRALQGVLGSKGLRFPKTVTTIIPGTTADTCMRALRAVKLVSGLGFCPFPDLGRYITVHGREARPTYHHLVSTTSLVPS